MLTDVHLALVHEVEQGAHLADLDVAQVDDRMRVFVLDEDLLKVRTARRQYRLMCLRMEEELTVVRTSTRFCWNLSWILIEFPVDFARIPGEFF